jgi:Ca-activated chloride channel family protein
MEAIIKLWHQNKKPANIILMLDRSGGMRGEKIRHARSSALQLLEILKDTDYFSLLSFNHRFSFIAENVPVGRISQWLQRQIKYQFKSGGTALYDAIEQAYTVTMNNPQPYKISAIVVLSDGKDSGSRLSLQDLLNKIQFDSEKRPVRIFTICYFELKKNRFVKLPKSPKASFMTGLMILLAACRRIPLTHCFVSHLWFS